MATRKIGWGVIGAGGIAKRRTIPEGIVPASNAELRAVQDVDPPAAAAVARQFGARLHETPEALCGDPAVEAVYVATPVRLHKAHVLAALAAGKHVLVEKALATTPADAKAIVRAARKSGRYVTEGYMMRFHPLHAWAADCIERGRLGRVVFARAQLSCWYPPIAGAWRQQPDTGGGGSLIDMATHCLDLLRWFLGPVTEVSAFRNTQVHAYPVEDSATILLKFASGAHAAVDAFFCIRDEACCRRLELYGTAGGILADGTIGQGGGAMEACLMAESGAYDAAQARDATGGFQPVKVPDRNMYQAEVEYLSDCILSRTPPTVNTVESGLETLRLAWAAYRSAETGRVVRMERFRR
jgi:predicted dehydrogenase